MSENFARGLPRDAPRWPTSPDEPAIAVPLGETPAAPARRASTSVKLSAAWLIEKSGIGRGFSLPGSRAAVSSVHTLALVNTRRRDRRTRSSSSRATCRRGSSPSSACCCRPSRCSSASRSSKLRESIQKLTSGTFLTRHPGPLAVLRGAELHRSRDRACAVAHAQLLEDVQQVRLHCRLADEKRRRDRGVALPRGDERQHLASRAG